VLRVLDLLLQFVDILNHRLGVHDPTVFPLRAGRE
jgi:hypothetical protein